MACPSSELYIPTEITGLYLTRSSLMLGTMAQPPGRIFYCGNLRYGRQIGSQSPQGILYTLAGRLGTGHSGP
jgi:hypothetical protein